jgi:hypothetical protein
MKASAAQCPARPTEAREPDSEEHLEAMLDHALEATFPASDRYRNDAGVQDQTPLWYRAVDRSG